MCNLSEFIFFSLILLKQSETVVFFRTSSVKILLNCIALVTFKDKGSNFKSERARICPLSFHRQVWLSFYVYWDFTMTRGSVICCG